MPQLKSSIAYRLPEYLTIFCVAVVQPLTANVLSSTTTLAATPATAVYSQPVVLTASVAPASPSTGVAAPTGQVTFQDGANPIGTAALGSGIATLSLKALAVGVHTITAMYGGDSNWSSSQASTMVTISQAQTMSTVSLLAGYKVLAVVTPVAPATGTPTGSVALLDPRPTVAPLFKADSAPGTASVTVTLPGGSTLATLVTITPATPSIFAATMNGTGVYAGQIVHVHADGSQSFENSVTLNAATNTFAPTPINFGPSTDQIFLVL